MKKKIKRQRHGVCLCCDTPHTILTETRGGEEAPRDIKAAPKTICEYCAKPWDKD